eukprot:CAMPEP_0198517172 /NCGR_PEP_ID=MMETSP1462-20131121/18375_1 /TAXON_ID=1333877 /ORGANISM="Brandtodinium nutriculum, Strain RCC3387" /LENGTH=63 /DNA_ID=CAMNT_0044246725 /DNA_START=68 /DNA_END=259 /DNA_ORIENTATION=+
MAANHDVVQRPVRKLAEHLGGVLYAFGMAQRHAEAALRPTTNPGAKAVAEPESPAVVSLPARM